MTINLYRIPVLAALLGAFLSSPSSAASTPGGVKLLTKINQMTSGNTSSGGTAHYAVAWVTKADGTFIKTVWRQGSSTYTNSKWTGHFKTWTTARNSSTVTDGYTSATAANYTATANNPVTVNWNCQDASGVLVPDGNYIFRVQYAEDADEVDGPVTTTAALTWTKGPSATTVSPVAQGTLGMASGNNFTNMSIVWTPDVVVTPFDSWASVLPLGQQGPGDTPQHDGVTNLEKFAFNLNPLAPDVRHLTVGAAGLAGLPGGAVVGGKLRIEFLRRKASTNPGISYKPQFSTGLGSWVDFTGSETVTPATDPFERVVVDDTVGGSQRFGRVKVEKTP